MPGDIEQMVVRFALLVIEPNFGTERPRHLTW